MELIYRGTTFNYNPAERAAHRAEQNILKSPYELKYRGVSYRIDPVAIAETSLEPVVYELNYRGTSYQMHRDGQGNATVITSSTGGSKRKNLQAAK